MTVTPSKSGRATAISVTQFPKVHDVPFTDVTEPWLLQANLQPRVLAHRYAPSTRPPSHKLSQVIKLSPSPVSHDLFAHPVPADLERKEISIDNFQISRPASYLY